MTKPEHDTEFCPCKDCTDKLLAAHDAYLKAWIDRQNQRRNVSSRREER